MSTARIPGPLYAALRGYKEAASDGARGFFAAQLSGLLGRFLAHHLGCLETLAAGPLDLTVAVPPSQRMGDAPMHVVTGPAWSRGVLVRGSGPLGHLRASPAGYAVPDGARALVAGRSVLLVDDTYTTGARAQSAAAALGAAGARAVVVVVIGRVVRPERNGLHRTYWARARATGFSPGRCGLPWCRAGGSPGAARDPAPTPGPATQALSDRRGRVGSSPSSLP